MKKLLFILWILFTWISYPLLILCARRRQKNLDTKKNVLVIPQLTRIGDIVCSTPVFFNIKKTYPQSKITVLVSKKAFGIIKNNERIDHFIISEEYSWFGLMKRIQQGQFNWSINLSATSTNTCLALWGLIGNRIKTVVEKPPITEQLTDWMSNYRLLYRNHTYLPRHHIQLLGFMGIKNPEDKKEVWLSPQSENKAEMWRKGIPASARIIGLSISAGNKIKEFGDERFLILAQKLLDGKDIALCCIGSRGDAPRIEAFVKKVNHSLCFGVLNFSLEELPSLMKRFSLYIAVDTGPIYIAHALGVPLIDIIGPVDPDEQPPQDEKSIRILPRNDVAPSSFVFKRRGNQEEIRKAIESTDIQDVADAASRLLE